MSGKGTTTTTPVPVPASCRKIVQSVKEIVSNFPDHEIYATLRDCNMDPDEAVTRLLSQDTFHEVKSKREKKKESKDPADYRPSGTNNTSNRGGARTGTDRHGGRSGTNQFSSSDAGLLGKPVYKKGNGTPAYGGSAPGLLGNNGNRQLPSYSDSVTTENKTSALGMGDAVSSSSQQGGLQSPWVRNAGQLSMADIVKMGRPQTKVPMHNSSLHSGHHQNAVAPPAPLDYNSQSFQGHASKISETNTDQGYASVPQDDEWPRMENQQDISVSTAVDPQVNSEYDGEANWHQRTHLEEHVADDGSVENADNTESASISAKSTSEDNTGAEDGISSVTANMGQLNLQRDNSATEPDEDNPSLVIPDHLQLHTPECLNLSLGSFGPANNASLSGPASYASGPFKSNLDDASAPADVSAIGSLETRNPEYYRDEHLATTSGENLVHGNGVNVETYEQASVSQEALKPQPPEAAQENQYSFPSSSHGFNYETAQQPEVPFPQPQTSLPMQNLGPFSNVMAYTNSLPSSLLASTVQTAREDSPYSPFPSATQSMHAKYGNITSSIGGPSLSMSEALRSGGISAPQPNPQTLPGGNVATGPGLPQHVAVHPYSQPSLPMGHFANMISYPILPQSYTYMPSAFQQGFAGNSTYPQSLAALLPQYKNGVSVSMTQSTAIPPGYGFGSSTNVPGGNFPLNPPTAPTGTTIGYDDVINSQFKDNSHMMSLQQNENSVMWPHGPGSRSVSALPPSMYFNLPEQNQQGGFRQRQQQPSQNFGSLGYPNFYQSQAGVSLEPQQQQHQHPREANLGGSQNQPAKQSQQLWQNSY
ncbi:uncharacterized protein LOC107638788 isoform X2 [Arachis ipaensis]|uniref:uncharacterized protein LOC107638788 isoform X2 n=1 Tax=Arachis ipaensis TaxID=130454 RepID=UPI0007AF7166|nr:uncharacterized protein LOC107638788 isoform X2 [Arachis ipaensis]XP_025646174.1 uncharacterized protein LOC112741411 isoform X2 [Arachis hypogaea]QHO06342.1 uncharacterized protein DS421_14g453850 [Arachis hypogaea]